MPGQALELRRVDAAREEPVRLGRLVREELAELLGGEVLGVGLEERARADCTTFQFEFSRQTFDSNWTELTTTYRTPSSLPTFPNMSSANCRSSRVCVAVTIVRKPRLAARHGREADALREDAALEQPIRHLHGLWPPRRR